MRAAHRSGRASCNTQACSPPLQLEAFTWWGFQLDGRVCSRWEARHLIRNLSLRLAEGEDEPVHRETCQGGPGVPASQNYAPSA
jgi:hypothetical protein